MIVLSQLEFMCGGTTRDERVALARHKVECAKAELGFQDKDIVSEHVCDGQLYDAHGAHEVYIVNIWFNYKFV